MRTLRIAGLAMFVYGAVMLLLLLTPWREWALEHSIAAVVSRTDRRVGNTVDGPVDLPIALAGSAVVMLAGLWFGLLVPFVIRRSRDKQQALIAENMAARGAVAGPADGR